MNNSKKRTMIDNRVIDIGFIKEYYNTLSDYDKDLLLRECRCKSYKKRKNYFEKFFKEIEEKCKLTHDDTKKFLNLCIQCNMSPYPFYRSNTIDHEKNLRVNKNNSNKKRSNKFSNSSKNQKNRSFEKWVEIKEKEDLENKMKKYKQKPAQYLISTTEPPSSKIAETRKQKFQYDEVPEFLQNVIWKKSDIVPYDVYVFHGFLSCSNRKHELSFFKVKIQDLKHEYRVCEANVIYCNDCDRFFIDSTQYKRIIKKGYLPNMRIHSPDTGLENFRQESELALYGYNAQKTTPKSTRQRILYEVISNRLMTVGAVISHLEGLIELAEYNERKQDVIKRYRDDIMLIHNSFDNEQLWKGMWEKNSNDLIVHIKIPERK